MMYRPEINTNPMPSQMFELAAIAVCLAKDQGKLRESKRFNNAHLFVPQKRDEVIIEEDRFKGTTQMFAGRVARDGFGRHRSWSMWLVEKFWAEDDGQTDASRTTHHFIWNNDEVVTANRVIAAPMEEEVVYDADRITVDLTEFNDAWLNAKYQLTSITEADCRMLIRELKAFSQISQQELQYNR